MTASIRVPAAKAAAAVAPSAVPPKPDDTAETEAAKAGLAVAPSLTCMFTSREGGVAMASAVDAAVATASSAARWRTYERKEGMCPAVGGTVVIGTGSAPASVPTSAVETAVAVASAAVSTVASREEEAARAVAAGAVGIVVSSAASEGILGKWGAELPPVPVSR